MLPVVGIRRKYKRPSSNGNKYKHPYKTFSTSTVTYQHFASELLMRRIYHTENKTYKEIN